MGYVTVFVQWMPPPGATAMAAVLSERSGRPSEINDEISLCCASSWKRLFTNAGTAKTRWDERGATVKWGAFLWGRRGLGEVTFLLPSIWKGTCLCKLRGDSQINQKTDDFFRQPWKVFSNSRIRTERTAALSSLRVHPTDRSAHPHTPPRAPLSAPLRERRCALRRRWGTAEGRLRARNRWAGKAAAMMARGGVRGAAAGGRAGSESLSSMW